MPDDSSSGLPPEVRRIVYRSLAMARARVGRRSRTRAWARERIAGIFGLTAGQVRAIEQEGDCGRWPRRQRA